MPSKKRGTGRITESEMNQPSEYGGDPAEFRRRYGRDPVIKGNAAADRSRIVRRGQR